MNKIDKTQTGRNSNIELLRIIAMLMILVLHVDFFALGGPSTQDALSNPMQTFAKVSFEMLSLISVNLFILISGWFSINASIRGFMKLLFQCVFIITLMYVVGLASGMAQFSVKGLLECVFMSDNAWFVKSYCGLYIIAPALNSYTEKATDKQLLTTLILFYSFQTLYGCIFYNVEWINNGNSAFSFIGLYLLARYVRLYCQNIYKYGLWLWIGSLLLAIFWYWLPLRSGHLILSYMAIHYSSPTTIAGALGLLIWVASKPVRRNSFINWVAGSCFAVYLYHVNNDWTSALFRNVAREIYTSYSGLLYYGVILSFIILVFAGGVIIDQLRKLSWSYILWLFTYTKQKSDSADRSSGQSQIV